MLGANFPRPAVQVTSSPRPQQVQFRHNNQLQPRMNEEELMATIVRHQQVQAAQAAQAAQAQAQINQQQQQSTPIMNQPKTPQQTSQDLSTMNNRLKQTTAIVNNGIPIKMPPNTRRVPAQNMSNDMISKMIMNQNLISAANNASAVNTVPVTKTNMPPPKGPSRNQTPKMAAAQVKIQGGANSVAAKMSISPVIQQSQNASPVQGTSTQVSQVSANTVNSPVIQQNTGLMLQSNSNILQQANAGINIQNAARPNMMTNANSNPILNANMFNMLAKMSNNSTATSINPAAIKMAQNNNTTANAMLASGVNVLQSNAMLVQNNPMIAVARPNTIGTQASSIGIANLSMPAFRPNSQSQPQSNTQTNTSIGQSSSSTPATQTGLAVLNEKEAQEASNQIATIDARAKDRRIQYHEIHDLTDDEKNKIMDKLKELQPMYHEVDNVLPYFWHYTKSSQGTYRLLGMKYMIEDQLKALPDKFLLRLDLVESLLQQFRKYFIFVESRRRGIIEPAGFSNANPVLPQQRPQPQVESIIPPRMNLSDLKLPTQKQHSRDSSAPGSSTGNKKRRQSSTDEQPNKKVASSKQSPDVVIIDPPTKSAETNATIPAQSSGNSIIVISDDIVKSEEQQLQKNVQAKSSQEVIVNNNTISLPSKEDASEELQKNYIDEGVSMEGVRKQAQRLVHKGRELMQVLQPPVRAGRDRINGLKSQDIPSYDLGGWFALHNIA
ncbi:mediator complex subunit 15-domain-containing protein [Glomus cerebriforme]|uniref:Mediator complex subunit 15-domain-containing protein n=1 Tax=Glomus cerebriforme TaxID=658196 RepID=A0A397TDF0_9GLOM|nr:mediator complex subunit 15-domain-containing protein [Glomus cerebriforme]